MSHSLPNNSSICCLVIPILSGTTAALAVARPLAHSARFESNPATRETLAVKWTILALGLAFFALFLLMPLVAVFVEALRKGVGVYFAALTEPDAVSALTQAVVKGALDSD